MKIYQETSPKQNPSPAMIRSFEEGFLELRHEKGAYKGRLLFYKPSVPKATEDLVILRVFRKQTQKTPKAEVDIAEKRMEADLKRRNDEREDDKK